LTQYAQNDKLVDLFGRIALPRLSPSRVRRHLVELISTGRYLPGDRLPTERVLAEQFDTSRSTVRDALALLEGDGVVSRRRGSGTYVTDRQAARSDWSPQQSSPRDTMDARMVLEPRLARVAALTATSEDLDRIAAAERETREHLDSDAFERQGAAFHAANAAWAFHAAIAAATHNRLLVSMYDLVGSARDEAEWGDLKNRSLSIENRRLYVAEHAAILKALRLRDAEQAEQAALAHCRSVRKHMLGE
jgi:GntR family uxuAB operon transcriptional repressor